MHLSGALCERELSLEMADVLPHRDTLGIIITVAPTITVVTGVAVAIQALTNEATNIASVLQFVHV